VARSEFADHETLLATLPATSRQRRSALAVAVLLLLAIGVLAPFASTTLPQFPAFVSSVEVAIFITDLITSILLFAQFSIYRSRALLTIASGYLFAALIVIPHAISFPGAFAPTGLLGGSFQSTGWFFIIWHTGFSVALLGYALLKDEERAKYAPRISTAIGWSIAIVIGLVCGVTWVAAGGDKFLPPFYLDRIHPSPLLQYVATLLSLICVLALALLWIRRRSVLDQWLMVVACATVAELAFVGLFGAPRFSLGFYAGRTFSLVTSTILLVALLVEMTRLYARLVRSNIMLQHERNNKLMNLDAMVTSISHEVRQPLAAIAMNGDAALEFLELSPPKIEDVRSALKAIVDDTHRTSEIFDGIRALFGKTDKEIQPVDVNETVLRALHILRAELKNHDIITRTELTSELPLVMGHVGQLQEVILNLVQNAMEAMASTTDRSRVLRIRTERHGRDEIAVSVEDSGPGIDSDKMDGIFEPFITTKDGGMGLGLAICRMIIERHEGRLTASSEIEGGALFRFILPIQTAEGSVPPPL